MQEIFESHRSRALKLRNGSINVRKQKLRKLLRWIYAHRNELGQAVSADMNKSQTETELTEIQPVTGEIKMALRNINRWTRPKKVPSHILMLGTTSVIHYEPKGTSLIIAPWNYPFNLCIMPLVSAIAAGNTAVLKPSERTPYTADFISRMISELFDPEEITVVQGAIPETRALLQLPFDHIFFTGSPTVGKIVMAAAAKHLTSVTLELGGKSPAIVDETASVNDAATKIAWGKFLNSGQTCIAPDYILVHDSKYEELKKALVKKSEQTYNAASQGFDKSPDYTGIVDERHVQQLDAMLENAISKGAKTILGGESNKEKKFFPPTILEDVQVDTSVLKEEIFGPILPLVKFSHLDEAIRFMNDKPKPLALYFFSRSRKNQAKIIRETSSGAVDINDNLIHFSNVNIPFGGVNNSGIGKSHGHSGFLAFSNEKPVMRQRVGFTLIKTFYPPYTPIVKKWINFIVDYF